MQRVFIGIPVDTAAQQHINELLGPIRKLRPDIRWVPENNRHMTLAFLGNMARSVVVKLQDEFDETYQRQICFQYKLTRLTRFPGSNGRIIALCNELDRSLDSLFQTTSGLLQANRLELDRKEFRPHITLGKIRKAKQLRTTFKQPTDISLDISRIILYQSTVTDSGSIYSVLKETPLSQ
jgi:2'-5' RNA ligase